MSREEGQESLRNAVKRLDKDLWHQLEYLWRKAERDIHEQQRSKEGHQQGTQHCLAVEKNLTRLIPDKWKGTRFTAVDLFLLSAAAALHDVGKAGNLPDDHGHVSMWEVRRRAPIYGLEEEQAEVVGWVVQVHNDGKVELLDPKPIPLGSTAKVFLRPLAAVFKLADVLHNDLTRIRDQSAEFGGRDADENLKTRFRRRVRGWCFDDYDRIEIYAVPRDWVDAEVIYTGVLLSRQELDPVVPTLQDVGLPWELVPRLEETAIKCNAKPRIETNLGSKQAFVGLDPLTEKDAHRFKGRHEEVEKLWQKVNQKYPLTLLVGDPRIGKTSLIRAGLFPLAHSEGWHTIYTCALGPDRSILPGIWHDFLGEDPGRSVTILGTLARVSKAMGDRQLLVALDQFEDVVNALTLDMRNDLCLGLQAVLAGFYRNLHLLVSYSGDVETVVGPLFQEITASPQGPPRTYLQPLGKDGARNALESGFAEAHISADNALLERIVEELQGLSPTKVIEFSQLRCIFPPHIQMVGETLYRLACEKHVDILTLAELVAKGGCDGIIESYSRNPTDSSEAWARDRGSEWPAMG